jgi:hypothetical protein
MLTTRDQLLQLLTSKTRLAPTKIERFDRSLVPPTARAC